MVESGINLEPFLKVILQTVPVWGLLGILFGYLIRRMEKNAESLEARLKSIESKIEKFHEDIEFADKRSDAADLAISVILKDSFSSKMIARGTGVWPHIFGVQSDKGKA